MADWINTVFQNLVYGQYNSTKPTVQSGGVVPLQTDSKGRLAVTVEASVAPGQTATRARYVGPVAGSVGAQMSNRAIKLVSITAQNRTANDRYLLLFDQTNAPTSGATVPKLAYLVPAQSFIGIDYEQLPHEFAAGIFWAVSTQPSPYFLASDLFFTEAVLQETA